MNPNQKLKSGFLWYLPKYSLYAVRSTKNDMPPVEAEYIGPVKYKSLDDLHPIVKEGGKV